MNFYDKFRVDLKIGKKYENWFSDVFLKTNYITKDDKTYDVIHNNIKYEIKCDKLAFVYYRVGFECSTWSGLSGIHTTKADYWVNILPVFNIIQIIKIDTIKKFIKEHQNMLCTRNTGDNKASKMLLWDYDYLMENIKNYSGYKEIKTKIPNYYSNDEMKNLINTFKKYISGNECKERRLNSYNIDKHYDKTLKIVNKLNY